MTTAAAPDRAAADRAAPAPVAAGAADAGRAAGARRAAPSRRARPALAVVALALALGATFALYLRPGLTLDLGQLMALCGFR